MTWQLARRSTVTGTCSPPSVKTRVIPTFCAITPERMFVSCLSRGSELDLDVDAGGEIELHQRVHRLRRRIDDVEQPLVRAHLELLTALLVDVWRTVDRELLDPRRQRDRAAHLRTGALGGRHDLARRRIEDAVIERLEPDPDILAVHGFSDGGELATSETWDERAIPLPVSVRPASSVLRRLLLGYADHHAGADGFAALADGKALLLLHRDRRDQLHVHGRVVARHDHLRALRQRALPGHIRGPEVKLRTVIVEERRVPPTLLLGQDIRLSLELLVRLHRPRLAQNLTALDRVLVDPAQQTSHIVARYTLVQKLAEHLNPR